MTTSKADKEAHQEDKLERMKAILSQEQKVTRSDDSRVQIAEMQINALLKLADDKNRVFSQIKDHERFDVDRALMFSKSALPSLTGRLQEAGITKTFSLPILTDFIEEYFRLGHIVDRGRAEEYLQGLKNIGHNVSIQDELPKRNLMQRMV